METKTYWVVKSVEVYGGIYHTTAFTNKIDAEHFLEIIKSKRPKYNSSLQEVNFPFTHDSLYSACKKWGF